MFSIRATRETCQHRESIESPSTIRFWHISAFVEHGAVQRRRQNRLAGGRAFQHHVPTTGINAVAREVGIGDTLGHTRAVYQIGQEEVRCPLDNEQSMACMGGCITSVAENSHVVAIPDPDDRLIGFAFYAVNGYLLQTRVARLPHICTL